MAFYILESTMLKEFIYIVIINPSQPPSISQLLTHFPTSQTEERIRGQKLENLWIEIKTA